MSGFTITTYADILQIYRIDFLGPDVLVPTLDCDFPCWTCYENERDNCESCWTFDWSEMKYFYTADNGKGICDKQCPDGMTRDNSDSYRCIDCDVSCSRCKDENKLHCIDCSPEYPFKLSGTPFCLPSCYRGFYETGGDCARCEAPCADCVGQAKNCILCDPDSEFPVLFVNEEGFGYCLRECAVGYTEVNGRCERCESPCATCYGSTKSCTSCDGTLDRTFLYSNLCYA